MQGPHFEPGASLVSRDARSNSLRSKYFEGDIVPREKEGLHTVSGALAILHGANLPIRSKEAPGSFGTGRSHPDPHKKIKRPSFTDIGDSVDEIADEVNKRADEIAAVVKSVPLPLASSDIEREKQVEGKRSATRKTKGQPPKRTAHRKLSLHPSAECASRVPTNVEPIDNVKSVSKPRLLREASVTTLVSTLSEYSQTSNSSLTVTSGKQLIPKHKTRIKRIRDSDSEADPLNL